MIDSLVHTNLLISMIDSLVLNNKNKGTSTKQRSHANKKVVYKIRWH